MAERDPVCTACFPESPRPHCRVFDDSSGAFTIYSGLHATGKAPAMCQGRDGRFRVCHQPAAVMVQRAAAASSDDRRPPPRAT